MMRVGGNCFGCPGVLDIPLAMLRAHAAPTVMIIDIVSQIGVSAMEG